MSSRLSVLPAAHIRLSLIQLQKSSATASATAAKPDSLTETKPQVSGSLLQERAVSLLFITNMLTSTQQRLTAQLPPQASRASATLMLVKTAHTKRFASSRQATISIQATITQRATATLVITEVKPAQNGRVARPTLLAS